MFFRPKRYYLDYAASTPVSEEVVSAMQPYWSSVFANPNSIHEDGLDVKRVISKCEEIVRKTCHMRQDDQVMWTSGGTQSNHMAIDSVVNLWKHDHPEEPYTIVISSVEHPSIVNYIENKHDPLLTIKYMPVDQYGEVDVEYIENEFVGWTNVIVVSCIFQSSEVGVTQPVKKLVRDISAHKRLTSLFPIVHIDASQGIHAHKCNFQDWGADLVTLCGQKINGPKGSGALLVKKPYTGLTGDLGTPAVPLVVGFTRALGLTQASLESTRIYIEETRKSFFDELNRQGVSYVCNGQKDSYSHIINLSFPDCDKDSEELIVAFDNQGLMVSSKSACMGSQKEDSRVLQAMGVDTQNSIRISFPCGNDDKLDKKDIQEIVCRIAKIVA